MRGRRCIGIAGWIAAWGMGCGDAVAPVTSGGGAPQAAAVVRDALGVSLLRVEPDLDIDGAYARWFDRHACDAVLVRPDHIVFGSGQGPDAASRLLVALSERLQPTSFE